MLNYAFWNNVHNVLVTDNYRGIVLVEMFAYAHIDDLANLRAAD